MSEFMNQTLMDSFTDQWSQRMASPLWRKSAVQPIAPGHRPRWLWPPGFYVSLRD
jgi:hypothetical protein